LALVIEEDSLLRFRLPRVSHVTRVLRSEDLSKRPMAASDRASVSRHG
jgi:hypothetical protein